MTSEILARTIFGEARGELHGGRVAVANVIMNRVGKPRWWGTTVDEVCKKPKQFSCWNSSDPNLIPMQRATTDNPVYRECIEIAEQAMAGELVDLTFESTHYHHVNIKPIWAKGKRAIIQIGDHLFFNNVN